MATKRGFQRGVYVSSKTAESSGSALAYGTAQAVDTMLRVSSDPFTYTEELVYDLDIIGGLEEATKQDKLSQDVRFDLVFPRVKAHSMAFAYAYALGAYAIDNNGTSRRHTFTPATVFEMPSFTAEDLLFPGSGSGLMYRYPGCVVDTVELSVARKGWWTMNVGCIGSGTRTAFATDPTAVEEPNEVPFKGGDASIYQGTAPSSMTAVLGSSQQTAGVTLSTKIVSLTYSLSNNISADDLYELAGGLVRKRAERSRRTQELSFTIELDSATYLDHLTDQDTLSLEIDNDTGVLGGDLWNQGFQLTFPELQYRVANVSGGTDKLVVDIEATVQQDASNGSIQVDVFNGQTTEYLTLNS